MTRRPQLVGRPYLRRKEAEALAEYELQALSLLPAEPTAIRIERFVERRFNLGAVTYEALPKGVLGMTVFGPKGVDEILVSRALVEESTGVSERRLRTTLAHEAGHGLFHSKLFNEGSDLTLFDEDPDVSAERILCREGVEAPGYRGHWWEFQANMMMAALLLPHSLVRQAVEHLTTPSEALGAASLPGVNRGTATRIVSETFDVNPVVARYRLSDLFPEKDPNQLTL